jgi:hypothetical protein
MISSEPAEVYAALHELLDRRPAWQRDAACREHPLEMFFPGRHESNAPAQAICARCLVIEDCAAYAASYEPTMAGIWAGTSERARKAMRRLDVRAA